jgi:hypothetical protein
MSETKTPHREDCWKEHPECADEWIDALRDALKLSTADRRFLEARCEQLAARVRELEGELLDRKQGWIAPEPVACPACGHPVTEHRATLSRGDGEWCDYGEWYVGCRKECDCRDWRRRTPSVKECADALGWEDAQARVQELEGMRAEYIALRERLLHALLRAAGEGE